MPKSWINNPWLVGIGCTVVGGIILYLLFPFRLELKEKSALEFDLAKAKKLVDSAVFSSSGDKRVARTLIIKALRDN